MTWETNLLVAAFVAFGLGLAADLVRNERLAKNALHLGTAIISAALALLALYFLIGDLRIEYVFTYTRTTYPWYYRLAGLWGGQKGTLLMWAAFLAIGASVLFRQVERARADGRLPQDIGATVSAMRRGVFALLLLFTGSNLVARTFAATPEYLLRFRPDGNGLQAVLLTPFMVIHPPIQFVFYALTGLLFAGGLAAVATRKNHWAIIIRPWTRFTWLLATLGLGLGGLWAYYVLNFGGFWAWDPVETANLIAWFPLTLLLHALLRYRHGEYGVVAPLFALLTLPAVLFSTVATRTGLWVSVHAFTDPSKNFARDPLVRLLNILETGELLRYLAALLLVAGLLAIYALALGRTQGMDAKRSARMRALATGLFGALAAWTLLDPVGLLSVVFQGSLAITLGRSAPIGLMILLFAGAASILLTGSEEEPGKKPAATRAFLERWITKPNLIAAGIATLAIAFLVIVLIQLMSVNGYDRAVYDARAPFVALPVLLVMALLFFLPSLGVRRGLAAASVAAALGAVAALVLPDHWELALVAPALVLAFAASVWRSGRHAAAATVLSTRDRAAGILLLAGSLLAFVYWANPPSFIDVPLVGRVTPSWGWAVPALVGALAVLSAAFLHLGGPRPSSARPAAFLLILLLGPWFLVSLCGIIAFFLVAPFTGTAPPLRMAIATRRPGLRKATIYLIHAALVAGLAGYAAATYESTIHNDMEATTTGGTEAGGLRVTILGSTMIGRDPEQNLPKEIHTRVLIEEDGERLHEATLTHWLVPDDTPGHYDARVTVVRLPARDLYLFPFLTEVGSTQLRDHTHEVTQIDGDVGRVELSLKVLPGMNLVWAGLWMLTTAMAANLALGGWDFAPTGAAAPRPQPRQVHNPATPLPRVP